MTYHESQKFRHPVIWGAVAVVTLLMWWGLVQLLFGVAFGTDPMPDALLFILWRLFGVGFPLYFYFGGLVTQVGEDGVSVRLPPFGGTHIAFDEIAKAEVRRYRTLAEYGGWGVRYGFRSGWAYNVSGDEGVQFALHSGKRLLIGSQRPQEFLKVLESYLK